MWCIVITSVSGIVSCDVLSFFTHSSTKILCPIVFNEPRCVFSNKSCTCMCIFQWMLCVYFQWAFDWDCATSWQDSGTQAPWERNVQEEGANTRDAVHAARETLQDVSAVSESHQSDTGATWNIEDVSLFGLTVVCMCDTSPYDTLIQVISKLNLDSSLLLHFYIRF